MNMGRRMVCVRSSCQYSAPPRCPLGHSCIQHRRMWIIHTVEKVTKPEPAILLRDSSELIGIGGVSSVEANVLGIERVKRGIMPPSRPRGSRMNARRLYIA